MTNKLVPKQIKLDLSKEEYQPILNSEQETIFMKSGLVTLNPGESVGFHNTRNYEELIIVLQGQGKAVIKGKNSFDINPQIFVYIPPETEHDMVNTGTEKLKYIYVVSKTRN